MFASGLLVAMAAAATGAQAAAGGAGSLDPAFGAGGKMLTRVSVPAGTGSLALVTAAAVQPDGDIVVG